MNRPASPRGALSSPFGLALWMLGGLGVVLGLMLFPLFTFEGLPPLAVATVWALPVVFWIYLAAGLIAWWRRPRNGVGMLLVWTGLGVWIVGLNNTTVPAFLMVNAVVPTLYGALVHLLVAFPTGRLSSPGERALVAGGYFAGTGLQVLRYFFDPPAPTAVWSLAGMFSMAQSFATTALSVAVAIVLIARLLRARPEHRRPLGVVYGYGIFVMVFVPLMAWVFRIWSSEYGAEGEIRDSLQIIAVAALPLVVLIAFLRGGFLRTADLETLGAWLGESEASRIPIRDTLVAALGDPTLAMRYWSTELRHWVNAEGLIAAEPEGGKGRTRHQIDLGGAPVAVIEYDGDLLRDPHEVERAANFVALALERERLTVELRASRQAVVESRERLFSAADAERRRIGRDLHDGLQARLVLIGVEAQRIATAPAHQVAQRATTLRDTIDQAAAELRAIVHDLVPPALVELGVAGAVEELVQSMPIPTRLDAAVPGRLGDSAETAAYLVVAEALTNVIKHAGATRCTVSLHADGAHLRVAVIDNGNARIDPRRGTGLAGIADRVAALGGASGVDMPPEGGTKVWAQIPCGS